MATDIDEIVSEIAKEKSSSKNSDIQDIVSGITLDRMQSVNIVPSQTKNIPPSQAAQILDLSGWSGLRSDIVARNVDAIQTQKNNESAREFSLNSQYTPKTAEWLGENPYHAALTLDDIHGLMNIEKDIQDHGMIHNMIKGFGTTGMLQVANMALRAPGGAIDATLGAMRVPGATGSEALKTFESLTGVKAQAPRFLLDNPATRWVDAKAEKTSPPEMSGDFWNEVKSGNLKRAGRILAVQAATNAPMSVALLAASAFGGTAGASAGLAAMGAGEAGTTSLEARNKGISTEKGQVASLVHGAAEVGGEYIGTVLPFKQWGEAITRTYGKEVTKRVFFDMFKTLAYTHGEEGLGEGATQAVQDLTDYFAGINPDALNGIIGRSINASAVGFVSGPVTSSISIGSTIRQNILDQKSAALNRDFLVALGNSVESSKVKERLPEKMKEVVERMTKDSPVENIYIDPNVIDNYFQSENSDPIQFMQSIGTLESYTEAKEHGGKVRIPTSVWAEKVIGTKRHIDLANDTSFAPDAPSFNEAQETAKRLAKVEEDAATESGAFEDIKQDIVSKLNQVGGFSPQEISAQSDMMAKRVVRRASILGVDPVQLWNSKDFEIERAIFPAQQNVIKTPVAPTTKEIEERANLLKGLDEEQSQLNAEANSRWNELLKGGIKEPPGMREEWLTLPLRRRNKNGEGLDIIKDKAIELGLMSQNEDIIEKIRSLKSAKKVKGIDSYLSAAQSELVAEYDAFGHPSDRVQNDTTGTLEEPPPFQGPVQGDLFGVSAGKVNPTVRYEDLYTTARKSGMTHPQAREYALSEMGKSIKKVTDVNSGVQREFVSNGGVSGFGSGRLGQNELFQDQTFPQSQGNQPPTGATALSDLVERSQALFPSLHSSYTEIIWKDPDFVKLTNDAISVIDKYLKDSTESNGRTESIRVQSYLHDVMHKFAGAAKEKNTSLIEELTKQFPDLQNEFSSVYMANSSRAYPKDKWFDKYISGKWSDKLRPKVGIENYLKRTTAEEFLQSSKPQTETPEFKRWFGNSVVTDNGKPMSEGGKPLVVYHGTGKTKITEFRTTEKGLKNFRKAKTNNEPFGYMNFRGGTFFSPDPSYAGHYADEGRGTIYPAYIKAENPLYMDQVSGEKELMIKDKTPDALILTENGQINEIAVIDPTQIKSAMGNTGAFDPNNPSILYQAQKKREPNLIIQHSITAEKLKHAMSLGGLPVPSLAITRENQGITGFGDITLIGHKDMADPRGYAKTNVFGADVYSPRYPTIHKKVTDAAVSKLKNATLAAQKEIGEWYVDTDSLATDGERYVRQLPSAQVEFAIRNGLKYEVSRYENGKVDDYKTGFSAIQAIRDAGLEDSYKEYAGDLFKSLGMEDRIFKGYANSGNKRYALHTLENVVKILKKGIRGGESNSNIYGPGQLRAKFTPKFRSVEQIQKAEGKLVSKEEFEKIKSEVETELFDVSGSLKAYYIHGESNPFMFTDTVMAVMEDSTRMGLDGALKKYGFSDVSDNTKSKVRDFMQKLANLPTEYFEAKILRGVGLHEFRGAVVPEGTSSDVIKLLAKHGLEVVAYKKGDDADRQAAVSAIAKSLAGDVMFQGNKGLPRARMVETPTKTLIQLFQNSDLSSLIHEMGHVYLKEMIADFKELTSRSPDTLNAIQQQYIKDIQTTLNYLGANSLSELTTEQHELWARSFEAYLREGVSPSPELNSAFARFRNWLVDIYMDIKGYLRGELNPEVRSVFDRLLASQEEISHADETSGFETIFKNFKDSGMSTSEAKDYARMVYEAKQAAEEDHLAKVMEQIKRENTKDWNNKRIEVEAEISDKVNNIKTYIALSVLQNGTMPNGDTVPDGMAGIKLSKDSLVQEFGKEVLDRLPRPYVYSRSGGISAGDAAEIFGYADGTSLINDLSTAMPRKEMIQQWTDSEMQARYGDKRTVEEKQMDAMASLHNDKRAELLRAELKYMVSDNFATFKKLVKRIGKRVPTIAEVRAQAEKTILEKKVSQVKPSVYSAAESRAGREAFALMLKGDVQGAFDKKMTELYNHELFRAAKNAKDNVTKIVDNISRFERLDVRKQIGKSSQEILGMIDGLMERYEFRKGTTLKEIEKRKQLLAWVEEQKAKQIPISVPDYVLDESRRISYKDIPYQELLGVYKTIKILDHQAMLMGELLKSQDGRSFNEIKGELISTAVANFDVKKEMASLEPGTFDDTKEWVKTAMASHVKIETILEELDGDNPLGVFYKRIFKPLIESRDAEWKAMEKTNNALKDIWSAYTKEERALWHYRKIDIPGTDLKLTKPTILSFALNVGNDYNASALLEGLQSHQNPDWTNEKIMSVLNTLDERDISVVNRIWSLIDSFWEEAKALEERVVGVAPEKVQAKSVTLKNGLLNGGYYPIKFNAKHDWRVWAWEEERKIQAMASPPTARAMTAHGSLIARKGTGGRLLRNDLSVISEHLQDVIHDITHREAVLDVNKIIQDDDIRNIIINSIGREKYNQFGPWIKSIAGERAQGDLAWLERLASRARSGMTTVSLGFKISSGLMQLNGYSNTVKMLGEKYAYRGLQKLGQNGFDIKGLWEQISAESNDMKYRLSTFDRDVRDNLKKSNIIAKRKGVFSVADVYLAEIEKYYFSIIGLNDLAVSIPTYLGAKEKAMDGNVKGIKAGDEKAAISYAEKIVRTTQSANSVMDLSAIQRGGELQKLFTMFYSQMNIQFNQWARTVQNVKRTGNFKDIFAAVFYLAFIPAVCKEIIYGNDEDKAWWKRVGKGMVTEPLESVIILRDIVGFSEKRDYEMSPATKAGGYYFQAAKSAYERAFGDKEELTRKDIRNMIDAIGVTIPFPTGQVWKSAEYFLDWMAGNEEPGNAAEGLWRTLVTGKRK